jgi:hypothetical protein
MAQAIPADSTSGLVHAAEDERDRSWRRACGSPERAARLAATDKAWVLRDA